MLSSDEYPSSIEYKCSVRVAFHMVGLELIAYQEYNLVMSSLTAVETYCFCLGCLSARPSATQTCPLYNLKTVQDIFMKLLRNI